MAERYAFEAVRPDDEQIHCLFDLLSRRHHVISHQAQPSFDEHEQFVRSHPYRAWYIVRQTSAAIGSFYITENNFIGLNISHQGIDLVKSILDYVEATYMPRAAVKSVRAGHFSINVAASNIELQRTLEALNKIALEHTYKV